MNYTIIIAGLKKILLAEANLSFTPPENIIMFFLNNMYSLSTCLTSVRTTFVKCIFITIKAYS